MSQHPTSAYPKRKVRLRINRILAAVTIFFLLIALAVFGILRACSRQSGEPPVNSGILQVPQNPTASPKNNPSDTQKTTTPVEAQNTKMVKPLNIEELHRKIKQKSESFPGTLGLVFHDFETDTKIEIRSGESFESASLIKIPIMVEVYRKISDGKLHPDSEMELKDSYKVGGAGVLKEAKSGTRYTVEKLVELMITLSDNTATDMLIDLTGMEEIEKNLKTMGLKKTTLKRKIFDFDQIDKGKDNLTSPEDMELLLAQLYEGNAINEKYRGQMLNILKSQKNTKMIPRYLPKDIQVAHKTGGLLGILHDCGIVYPPDRKPYILVLMSKNVTDTEAAEKQLAELSKLIYQNVVGE